MNSVTKKRMGRVEISFEGKYLGPKGKLCSSLFNNLSIPTFFNAETSIISFQ